MSDETYIGRVEALLKDYIGRLDRREYDDWLTMFSPDGYYAVLRNIELLDGDNVLLVGEDMKRLSGRVVSGAERDLRRAIHCIGWVIGSAAAHTATASFTLWLDGRPSTAGRYELELEPSSSPLKIRKCTVVLDTIDILDTIYLPI